MRARSTHLSESEENVIETLCFGEGGCIIIVASMFEYLMDSVQQ